MDEIQDEIRQPDKIIKEKLIDNYFDFSNNEYDNELRLALDFSQKEYFNSLIKNDSSIEYDNINLLNDDNNEDTNKDVINKNSLEELELALKLSEKEYYDELEEIARNESIFIENEKIKKLEMDKRIKSLELFSKKIERLTFTDEDISMKKYVQSVLNDYYHLIIDYVNVSPEIYDKLYKIIDTYYLIPTNKKYLKTSISKEEDEIIRNIFRKE